MGIMNSPEQRCKKGGRVNVTSTSGEPGGKQSLPSAEQEVYGAAVLHYLLSMEWPSITQALVEQLTR
jgi:hypothetical protein